MKYLIGCFFLVAFTIPNRTEHINSCITSNLDSTNKIFIITIDGFRWQELFNGADTSILKNENFVTDAETIAILYDASNPAERRKKLMPFMWSVVSKQGQLYGNRAFENNVNVANPYAISYAGYNEMFTGKADLLIASNSKIQNNNRNIFEFLNSKPAFKGKIALFSSWDVFPYILNEKRSGIEVNSGYENIQEVGTDTQKKLNTLQTSIIENKEHTRQDMLTFIAAKEYLEQKKPAIFYIGLGETDEYAHKADYAMYLQKANEADKIIADLWHWVQTHEGYKGNTTFIITTDHGRGQNKNAWPAHGIFTKGSSQTWLALMGKNIEPMGEVKLPGQIYQKQIAQTIAHLVGEHFGNQDVIETTFANK